MNYVLPRVSVGAVLVLSSVTKASSPTVFVKFLPALGLPLWFAQHSVLPVVLVELSVGICLIFGIYLHTVSKVSFSLFILFSSIIVFAIATDVKGSCGCFGNLLSSEVSYSSILRNLLLAGLSIHVGKSEANVISLQNWLEKSLSEEEEKHSP